MAIRKRPRGLRATGQLAVGSALSGLMAYAFFITATRALGAVEASAVSVLWTYWGIAAAAVTFPLQHWIARGVTAGDESAVARTLPRVWLGITAASLTVGLISWLLRNPLFGRDDPWFPLLCLAVTAGSGLVGVSRGGLAAREGFGKLAASLALENAGRFALSGAFAIVGVANAVWYGLALVAGQGVALLWPSALRFSAKGAARPIRAWGFLSGSAAGQLLSHVTLMGGPILLALTGGTATDVTAFFAALALYRAPYIVALGVLPQLTNLLTTLTVQGSGDAQRRVRQANIIATLSTTLCMAVFGYIAGPTLLAFVFGPEVSLTPEVSALVSAGSTIALGSLVASIALMARLRARAIPRAWLAALASAGVTQVLAPLPPLSSVALAFVVAQSIAFLLLALEESRSSLEWSRPAVV